MVLDHAEGAGGHSLAVLELPQRPLGNPGHLGKCPPVPHAQLDPARDDVIGEPLPVLTGHMTVLPPRAARSPHGPPDHTYPKRIEESTSCYPRLTRGSYLPVHSSSCSCSLLPVCTGLGYVAGR